MTVLLVSVFLLLVISTYPALELANYDNKYLYVSTAYGYSMYPTIKNGDLLVVVLKTSPYYHPEVGDVLIYRYSDQIIVAHRLAGIRGSTYIFKGDNNRYYEEVPEEKIIGEVIEVIPHENILACWVVENLIK
ncbi:MAG: signal peptidase I [Candidatus Aenigmatarchaeota archaeon]|nr:MAG: signal peptidase I [Candidatus Aenigmarchaeota archaeon]